MPLILKSKRDRIAFRLGARCAFRSTGELVDQIAGTTAAERARHRFNLAEKERQLAAALRGLAEVRYELA